MVPQRVEVAEAYLAHLSTTDVVVLTETLAPADPVAAEPDPERRRVVLGTVPGKLEDLLDRPEVTQAVLGPAAAGDPRRVVSPFLTFAAAVHRTTGDLRSMTHVLEWLGPGRRAPVFDVAALREFVASPWRRLFLIELLASYTHVASGSVVVSTRRGWRRQRFSELDPVRLAGLLEVVSPPERPGVLRRLGDLALFLTGVFPDHVARRGFGPIEEARLLRAGGGGGGRTGASDALGLLELLGRRWYRAAFELVPPPVPVNLEVVGELDQRFGQARRFLTVVTDRYLFPRRDRWFGLSGPA